MPSTRTRRRGYVALGPLAQTVPNGSALRRSGRHQGRGRLIQFVEAFLGVVVVTVAGLAIPGQWGLLHLQPHPLWIVVLAIAIRYGAPAGYAGGAMAALSYGLLFWLRPEARLEPVAPYDLLDPLLLIARLQPLATHDLIQPFLLFAGGAIVSEVRSAQWQRQAGAEDRYSQASEALNELTQRHRVTVEVKAELEKEVALQSTSLATLYEMAKKLQTRRVNEVYPAILDIVVNIVEAQACALYLPGDGQLHLQDGRPETWLSRPQTVNPDAGLIGRAIREDQVVTIRDRLLEIGPTALGHEPVLMAGPLRGLNEGLAGVVVVERIAFLKFTPSRIRLFGMILEWASAALQNAFLFEARSDRNIEDELTGAYTAAHAMKCLREDIVAACRYQLPLSIVVVQATGSPAFLPETLREIVTTLRPCLRHVDFIGHHPEPDKLLIVLPMTRLEGAHAGVQRMKSEFHPNGALPSANGHLSVRFGVAAFSPAVTGPEEMVERALDDLRVGSERPLAVLKEA